MFSSYLKNGFLNNCRRLSYPSLVTPQKLGPGGQSVIRVFIRRRHSNLIIYHLKNENVVSFGNIFP